MTQADLFTTLQRRRVTISRWLVDEQLTSMEDYENWKASHSDTYSFSPTMDAMVDLSLSSKVSLPEVFLPLVPLPELEPEEAPEEDCPADEGSSKPKKPKKKAVHTDETE